MVKGTDEIERPSEWLRRLREGMAGYTDLLIDSGEPVVAAYRLAAAKCRASSSATTVPTLREVHAAACELFSLAAVETPVPSRAAIADECEYAGLALIGRS